MPYRWNKNTIDQKDIVNSREFDLAHSHFTSLVNGGMDRENLPEECIGHGQMKDNCFGKMEITPELYSDYVYNEYDSNYGTVISDNNPRGNKIAGMRYGSEPINEGGAFFEVATQNINTEEGMLEISWKCNAYMPMYWAQFIASITSTISSRKRYQWQIEINGIVVYKSPAICQPFFTTNISINIPVGKGNQDISIGLRYPEKKDNDNSEVLLQWWGAQLITHNIYR